MALIFVDGFDFWTTPPGCWTSEVGTTSITASVLKIEQTSNQNHYIRWTFPDSIQTVIVNIRAAFEAKTGFTDEALFGLYFGDTRQCTVCVNSAGQLSIRRGFAQDHTPAGTQIGGYSTFGFVQDSLTFYDIEAKIVVANSGSCIIQVNGEEVLNVTGDLAASATESCNNILFGYQQDGNTSKDIFLEHVVIMDTTGTSMNDFIGPIKVNPHYLTADGNYTDFTANTGDRWDAVNDLDPDDDTTYISANVVGNKYTAVATNLPAGITTVHALAVWAKSQRDDDVTRAYKALLRYSGTDQLGSDDKYIGPNYAYQISTFDVSPFSATAWTPTEIDGLEVGVQITV